jgi:thiol-disulfide isomerase/thioredoxin
VCGLLLHRFIPAIAAVLLALTIAGCAGGADAVDQRGGSELGFVPGNAATGVLAVDRRQSAPEVRGVLLDGTPYDLAALRGTVTVVNFWGSWCAPCRAEAADLEQTYQATRAAGVQFVGVNVRDQLGPALAFVRVQGVSYPSLSDPDGQLAVRFRDLPPSAIPTTLVIDRDGRVAARFLGAVTASRLTPVVQQVAGEPA